MKLPRMQRLVLSAVMTTALGTATLVTVPQAYADDHAKCQREIEKREAKLDEAIRKHGERSHQADQRRHDLNCRAGTLLEHVPRMVERTRPSMAHRS